MIWRRLLLVFVAIAHLAPAASAGLFSRKPKPNPVERVPELLIQLKSSADEAKRSDAAEELRQFDPKAYPEIMPVLLILAANVAGSRVIVGMHFLTDVLVGSGMGALLGYMAFRFAV